MARYQVCRSEEIAVGALTRAMAGRSPILLSRLPGGEIKAFAARCPHQGADLGYGCISGATASDTPNLLQYHKEGEVLRCPWHGFEFCLHSGKALVEAPERHPMQLRFYRVEIEGDQVVVVT
jgi:nitrite reductase/ring-hydroxylating ferredoxin subunit